VAHHPSNSDLREETKSTVEEDAQVQKKDGEFCEVLYDNIENLGDVVKLASVSMRAK
jgi:hypothetical protein